jgi:hypothetical protein
VVLDEIIKGLYVDAPRKPEIVFEIATPLDRGATAVEDRGIEPRTGTEDAR